MSDPATLTAADLLAITQPEQLFPADDTEAKRVYHRLSRRWHPDTRLGKTDVFQHIARLYAERAVKLKTAVWEGTATVRVKDTAGREYLIHQLASSPFALGQSLVTAHTATYLIDPPHVALAKHALTAKAQFDYATDTMRDEFTRYLPVTMHAVDLEDDRLLVQVLKTPETIRLRDVVTHMGTLPATHVAWVVSSLLNICCYLSYRGIVHHDISPDTYFISPPHHNGALLGGWWHWATAMHPVTTLPQRTVEAMPFKARQLKMASVLTDLELVRKTALECLTDGPPAMRAWLETPGTGSAVDQYAKWMTQVLPAAFGPRKFIKLDVTAEQVYGKGAVHG